MKKIFTLLFLGICIVTTKAIAQEGDPEKILKLSEKKERLDDYLKDRDWKQVTEDDDEEKDHYFLYRKKNHSGGYSYVAIYPGEFLHFQKFDKEKRDYSQIMTYTDFIETPEGKTHENESIASEITHIKNIIFHDPANENNENRFYGIIPIEHVKKEGEQ